MLTAIKFRKGLCLRLIPETDPNEGNGGGSKDPPHLLAQLSTGSNKNNKGDTQLNC